MAGVEVSRVSVEQPIVSGKTTPPNPTGAGQPSVAAAPGGRAEGDTMATPRSGRRAGAPHQLELQTPRGQQTPAKNCPIVWWFDC